MILARESFEWANDAADLQSRGWIMFPLHQEGGDYTGDIGTHPERFPTVSTNHARTGSRSLAIAPFNQWSVGCGKMIPPTPDWVRADQNVFAAFGLYVIAGQKARFEMLQGAPGLSGRIAQCKVTINLDGSVQYDNLWGDGFTTAAGTFTFGAWNHFQVQMDRSRGYNKYVYYRVKVNGVLVVDIMNISNGTSYDRVSLAAFWAVMDPGVSYFGGVPTVFVDDLVWNDAHSAINNDWPGQLRVYYLPPVADGHYRDCTPSSGSSHLAMVNEHPTDHETTYLAAASGATPVKESFRIMGIGMPSGGTIREVSSVVVAEKLEAGSRLEDGLVRIAGTDYAAATPAALLNGYAVSEHAWPVNPATSAAWTPADVNAAEFGTVVT